MNVGGRLKRLEMSTIKRVGDKRDYTSLASLAAMMTTITTHRLHVKPGLTGHLKSIYKKLEKTNHGDDHEGG